MIDIVTLKSHLHQVKKKKQPHPTFNYLIVFVFIYFNSPNEAEAPAACSRAFIYILQSGFLGGNPVWLCTFIL